jgi:hypothetical protein
MSGLTPEERERIGERICWNCADRNVWSEIERIIAAHVAAAIRDEQTPAPTTRVAPVRAQLAARRDEEQVDG